MKHKPEAILIVNGCLIDPSQQIDGPHDLLLREGKVAEIGAPGSLNSHHAHKIDARGCVVAPGLIDIHVHLRAPGQEYKEDIHSGTSAAVAGGFTSVCAMPNTTPVNDSPEWTRWMQEPAREALAHVFPIAAATIGSQGGALTDYAALQHAGAVAVTDDGKPILGDDIMRKSLEAAGRLGLPVIQHAENTCVTGGCSMNSGPTSFRLGLRGMSVEAESDIVERDIRLARETGAHLHVAHISTAKALDAVRRAKDAGLRVTCEVTPHHFLLLDEHVGEYDTHHKMNPPLRSNADREAMLAGLLDGSLDCVATDHAPHAMHEKKQEFERAPMGITGLETSLGLCLRELHEKHGMNLSKVIALLSTTPAKVIGGPLKSKGSLKPGSVADVTIFDPSAKWNFDVKRSRSKSRNSPFDGSPMLGQVEYTIVGGAIVYQGLK